MVFAKNRQSKPLIVVSSILVIAGVLCKRVWLLFTSFVTANVSGGPGIVGGSSASAKATGMDVWSTVGTYAPTVVEILIVIGVIALCTLIFIVLASKLLPSAKEN
jgi:molybdopterin-containing oxidoreductase family membrane subunit